MLLIQSVGSVSFCIMSFISSSSIFAFTSECSETGMRHRACCTGVQFSFHTSFAFPMWPSPSSTPL